VAEYKTVTGRTSCSVPNVQQIPRVVEPPCWACLREETVRAGRVVTHPDAGLYMMPDNNHDPDCLVPLARAAQKAATGG